MDNIATYNAVSPIDGRYYGQTKELSKYVSESALMTYRVKVELLWLLFLLKLPSFKKFEKFKNKIEAQLNSKVDINKIKKYEIKTNHDVKAVEYYIRDAFHDLPNIHPLIHFACTSEDINNLAYGLMFNEVRKNILINYMENIIGILSNFALQNADLPMISRTHGQPASPTTLGKEFAVYYSRLIKISEDFNDLNIEGKINGAVGNYNAHNIALPDVDWLTLTKSFVEELGLKFNSLTTQIEPHDSHIKYLSYIKHFNTVLIGLCRDIWMYISMNYFTQQTKAGEVGSSTMPHKVNPIDFENAEGNLGLSIALAEHFEQKLPISRLQRDLSDSTVMRSFGSFFAYSLIAYKSLLKGLGKLNVNKEKIKSDIQDAWPVLSEPIQTIMRLYGVKDAYERLKVATRGKTITKKILDNLIDSCDEIPSDIKQKLKDLKPENYIGIADRLINDNIKTH